MPIIPTYQRQVRYEAPSVNTAAPAPTRLPQAYENDLQEFGTFSRNTLNFLSRLDQGPFQRQKSASPSAAGTGSQTAQTQPLSDAAPSSGPQADKDVSLRADLLQSVRDTAAQKGTVQTQDLDAFAAEHFTSEQADTPAVRDYLLLRRTAQQEARSVQQQQQRQLAAQEENLVRQVGSAAPSARALDAYLTGQLPAYEQRLKDNGAPPQTVQKLAAALQADTAASCVRRALAAGQDGLAQEVFEKYAPQFSSSQRQECAQKILFSAADNRARQLWERSALEKDASLQTREKWVHQQLDGEKNDAFASAVRQAVSALRAGEQARQAGQQAQVYRDILACGGAEEAQGVLNRQRVLEGGQLALARRAVQEAFAQPKGFSQAGKFNQLYFSSDEKAAARAYEKGQISARDYCVLESARCARQSGRDDRQTQLLCRGIERWGQQKGLPEKDVQDITYAVLSSAAGTNEPLTAWKQVKALFDL